VGFWTLIQVVFDIFAALGFFIILMRLSRQPKDDPRLSRGLQLLQSKISVLEDLSDRTENQVGQLTAILDQKSKEVQAKVQLADQHVHEIRVSMERSLDVAKIFQDKIPHQEIIERKNTIKYVQAAKLAHQGLNADEIALKVDLPKGEIEFIAKVNRDQLMFSEAGLPEWAKGDLGIDVALASDAQGPSATTMLPDSQAESQVDATARIKAEIEIAEHSRLVENLSRLQFEMQNLDLQLTRESGGRDLSGAFETPQIDSGSLQKIGAEFRKACEIATPKHQPQQANGFFPSLEQLTQMIPQIFQESELLPPLSTTQPAVAAPVQDPVLAKVAAQAKVREALSKAQPAKTSPPASATSMAIQAARAIAREQPTAPVIRKVQFPRIDSPK